MKSRLGQTLLICIVVGLWACSRSGPASSTADKEEIVNSGDHFELIYTASGGQPPVDGRLEITAADAATLYLGSSWSIPAQEGDTVGFFAGRLPAETRTKLDGYLLESDVLNETTADEPALPDAVVRNLVVRRGAQENRLSLTGEATHLADLEELLLTIMADLTSQPLRTAQASMMVTETEAAMIRPAVKITNTGSEPLPLVLFDPTTAGRLLGISLTFEQPVVFPDGMVAWQLQGEPLGPTAQEIQSLFTTGGLPQGEQTLAPGQTYSFELAPLARPVVEGELYLNGVFSFWLSGSGPERRLVYVQAARVELNPAATGP